MPLKKPATSSPEVAGDATSGRDRAVDVARLAALVMVMFGHCALLLATIDTGGLHIDNLLGEVPAIRPLTWVAQVMPLFFLAGGAAGAYGYRAGTPWGTWLFARAQRLCRPVYWYLAVWVVGLLVVRMILGAESAARLGRECVALLWFLGVYLVVLAFVPALTRLRSGWAGAIVVASLLAAAAAVDGIRIAVGTPESGSANFVIVWLIPVVIGVAYARRLVGTRAALVVAAGAFVAQVGLATTETYEVSLVVTGVERMSNVSPPTLLLALQCTWMSCLFVAVAGAIQRWAARPRVWHVVSVGNGGAMTIYLWHIPAIAVATFSLHAFGLDAYDVHAAWFWALRALRRHGRDVQTALAARAPSAALVGHTALRHRRQVRRRRGAHMRGGRGAGADGQGRAQRCRRVGGAGMLPRRGGCRAGQRGVDPAEARGALDTPGARSKLSQTRWVGSSRADKPDRQVRKCPPR
jgi:surface polysaccharide O-acyltransferase-like enzyme